MQLIVGNWKMHGTLATSCELAQGLVDGGPVAGAQLMVAPPFPFLDNVARILGPDGLDGAGSTIELAAQNCAVDKQGAFTGEVSAEMLASVGCDRVIVGHSERRGLFGETDDLVGKKVSAGLRAGLSVIACVGETLEERQAGQHEAVVARQVRAILAGRKSLDGIVIAYEPRWAIGTGHVATPEQAGTMHARVRATIAETLSPAIAARAVILYGGSVKPDNMESLAAMEGIDGALVGGASLDAKGFLAIAANAVKGEARRSKR